MHIKQISHVLQQPVGWALLAVGAWAASHVGMVLWPYESILALLGALAFALMEYASIIGVFNSASLPRRLISGLGYGLLALTSGAIQSQFYSRQETQVSLTALAWGVVLCGAVAATQFAFALREEQEAADALAAQERELQQHRALQQQELDHNLRLQRMAAREETKRQLAQAAAETLRQQPLATARLTTSERRDQLDTYLNTHPQANLQTLALALGVHGSTLTRDAKELRWRYQERQWRKQEETNEQ